ncbi:D-alanyl-D-alanine carboxypeptidase [Halomonas sp. LS-001]
MQTVKRSIVQHSAIYRTAAFIALTLLMLLTLAVPYSAQANPRYAGMMIDLESGEVLYAENVDERRYPASLVKMMTLYMAFEALESGRLSLNQPLPVSSQAAAKPAVKLWLPAGSTITVDEAIRALAVRSANDVAAVVAEALGGSESMFALQMTERARELGLTSTTFKNASGLPDSGQVTTARDMMSLAVHVIQDFPQYYHYFSLKSFTYKGKTHTSHNRLVTNYPGVDGLKTGFIRASGFNVATTAVRGNRRLVGIVMGGFTGQSRNDHMADLLDRGFMRAGLRDRGNWLANAEFSREYMHFDGRPPVYTQPTYTASRPANRVSAGSVSSGSASSASASNASLPSTPAFNNAQNGSSQNTQVRNVAVREVIEPAPPVTPAPAPSPSVTPAPPAPTTAMHRSSDWGIQLGAFSQENDAHRLASQAAQRLSTDVNGLVKVEAVPGQASLFRSRLVSLEEQQAYRACQKLRSQGMDCMVVNASL